MTEEGFSLFAAGTETVSWALTVITYHLLTKPAMLVKLKAEVNQAVDSSGQLPPWVVLGRLPYLGALIYEGLRLSYGLASRTSRIASGEDLFYRGDWTPNGRYAIGMSSVITHHDESISPDSHSFRDDGWMRRINLGKNSIAHSYWHQLYKITEADVTYDHDFFNPFPVWNSKGVRVIIV
ncbi:cytochrome P450 [Aspergillus leporis]|uniref:Cytochrome P450 n=1 Tax=Aspergillus leporis TaxID=41062 RepID=A0A5N5WHB1_9EURO|nr:cytochrome P450 [Aspergillus leporis]